jgi:hypothetical protein
MAVTVTRIAGPHGSDVHFGEGMAKVGYKLTGDGTTNGAFSLPFHKLESIYSVQAPQEYVPVINNTTKQVTGSVPTAAAGGLANGATVEIWLSGKGGH